MSFLSATMIPINGYDCEVSLLLTGMLNTSEYSQSFAVNELLTAEGHCLISLFSALRNQYNCSRQFQVRPRLHA